MDDFSQFLGPNFGFLRRFSLSVFIQFYSVLVFFIFSSRPRLHPGGTPYKNDSGARRKFSKNTFDRGGSKVFLSLGGTKSKSSSHILKVMLYFTILRGTNLKILIPKLNDDHPRHFYR